MSWPASAEVSTSGGSESAQAADTLSATRMWMILCLVLVADALDLIDATITTIAAPTIVEDIGGGQGLVKRLTAAYALSLGTLLVIGGRLGDRYGQRRLFLVGLAGFTGASTLAGVAGDPTMLIASRALQGAFGALLIPQGMAIMTKTFPRDMLRQAFAAFGPLLGLAAVGGPVLGGFVIDADVAGLSWRPMFLINIVLGGLCFVVARRVLPRDDGDPEVKLDLVGSVLLGIAMLGLLYGLIDGSTAGWTAFPVTCLAVAAVSFGGFGWRQATAARPLINPSLFRNRGFTSGLLMGLLFFAAINGLSYVISLFMQLGLGYDPSRTSVGLLPVTIGIIVGAGIGMGLIVKLGRYLVLIGLLTTLAGTASMLAVINSSATDVGWLPLSVVLLVVGIGAGVCFGTIFDTALGDTAPEEAGAASGSMSAVQQIAAALGSATVTSVYFASLETAGQVHALSVSLLVVIGITTLCVGVVWLLPRKAVEPQH